MLEVLFTQTFSDGTKNSTSQTLRVACKYMWESFPNVSRTEFEHPAEVEQFSPPCGTLSVNITCACVW